jgi:hypothetical protein
MLPFEVAGPNKKILTSISGVHSRLANIGIHSNFIRNTSANSITEQSKGKGKGRRNLKYTGHVLHEAWNSLVIYWRPTMSSYPATSLYSDKLVRVTSGRSPVQEFTEYEGEGRKANAKNGIFSYQTELTWPAATECNSHSARQKAALSCRLPKFSDAWATNAWLRCPNFGRFASWTAS